MFRIALRLILAACCVVPVAAMAQGDPLRGFVSIEPNEIRVEALVRPAVFAEAWEIEGNVISGEAATKILSQVEEALKSGVVVSREGRKIEFTGANVRFITPHPERGYISDDRKEIPLDKALVGVHLSAGESLVDSLKIEWHWFAPGQDRLVLEIASSSRPAARYVSPDNPVVDWTAEEVFEPTEIEIPPVVYTQRKYLNYLFFGGLTLLVFAGVLVLIRKSETPPWNTYVAVTGALSIAVSFIVDSHYVAQPKPEKAQTIAYSLLRNIYHAFDFREESEIYDVLAESVSGVLLESVYLEVLESLELGETGGPRVRIKEIDLRECTMEAPPENTEGFYARCEWVTIGDVTHWGHTHERTNLYEAKLRFDPQDYAWRITELDLLNEQRMQKVSRSMDVPPGS